MSDRTTAEHPVEPAGRDDDAHDGYDCESTGANELEGYLGAEVVVDTTSTLIYLGRLVAVGAHFIAMQDADVHDMREGATNRERYVLEACQTGIRKNREEVLVRRDLVVSLSRLADVTRY